ncbi:MAG: TRAP transporter large permease subunit, partial [Chloroflexota bacterium]
LSPDRHAFRPTTGYIYRRQGSQVEAFSALTAVSYQVYFQETGLVLLPVGKGPDGYGVFQQVSRTCGGKSPSASQPAIRSQQSVYSGRTDPAELCFMIPPSSVFILYGIITEQSIGKLFIAGILPGILITVLFGITALFICWLKPEYGPAGASTTLKQKFKSLMGLADALILFLLVMGGLFAGFFSPTMAGAIGSAGAIVIGVARRELNWRNFIEGLRDSLRLSCMIFILIVGALIFGHFVTATGLSQALLDWAKASGLSPLGMIVFVSGLFFILGCFIDISPIILLLVPLFYPLILESGYDVVWFGVVVVTLCMIGIITPPVGTNIFVTKGLAGGEVSLNTVIKGVLIFLIPMVVGLVLIIAFPQISLFLPSFMTY